ncbi:MAG: type II toxin-antitoxin system VapC family toxin [Thiotrichales bacterium]|nr:type II toxin-antitoxin system VapC family toxin [Thiotrichales bacterium]MCY4284358.1 type II toxin-antitoxin system VapC family toxin [Thiotrichales bacterium]MCY4350961.1 type II toxin-antitoxin system VapC family toxin [Thiotrichales bacterium]
MARIVLDASAVLAVILEEPGAEVVVEALRIGAVMSTVNVAEVAARLNQDGWSDAEVAIVFDSLGIELLPFGPESALLSGRLRTVTRKFGLGLGDRACLASAFVAGCPVLTSDRTWEELDITGLDVRCIR